MKTQRDPRTVKPVRGSAALAALAVVMTANVQAGVVFFPNDLAGFTTAVTGSTFLGTETFEGSTLPPGGATQFADPLTQGVPNGPYPAGLVLPMTVQSNASGGSASAPNPRGAIGLAAAAAGFAGNTSDVVVPNLDPDSLDWIFAASTRISAVGLNPLNLGQGSTVEIEVYDIADALLGSTSIAANAAGTNFLGIQTTAGDLIGRINFFQTASFEGGDNAMLYAASAVPAPLSLALVGLGLGALALTRRRKKGGQSQI